MVCKNRPRASARHNSAPGRVLYVPGSEDYFCKIHIAEWGSGLFLKETHSCGTAREFLPAGRQGTRFTQFQY